MDFAEADGSTNCLSREEAVPIADLRRMTAAQFRHLGMSHWVYLRYGMFDGRAAYGIYAADGTAMAVVEDVDVAIEIASVHDMTVVALH